MPGTPCELLKRLFEYIGEQAKDVDPRAFQLKHGAFDLLKWPQDLAGLPGVQFDIRLEGDHIWLQVERLEASSPPRVPEKVQGLLRISAKPDDAEPRANEVAIVASINRQANNKSAVERQQIDAETRAEVAKAFAGLH